ncbi:ORF6N domain-containing protein [Parabacteroides sp. OttesenSCG-928-O15]|nr:ORF6N domain-containing protein [Parabacteroides sp. OttesenSCG-928-O15]
MKSIIKFDDVKEKIIRLRDQEVILDSDVASLYGVKTMRINEAVKNNPDKFPQGYVFQLTQDEKTEVIENFDNLGNLKFSPSLPKAFTERGLYMLATILKSPQATETTLAIVETFAKLRELSRTITELSQSPEEHQQKALMQKSGDIITDLLGENLSTTETETCIELNFAVLKLKHTVSRKK